MIQYIFVYTDCPIKNIGQCRVVQLKELASLEIIPEYVLYVHTETYISAELVEYLWQYNIRDIRIISSEVSDMMYQNFLYHIIDFYQIYSWLSDDISRKVFINDIKGDYTGSYSEYIFANEPQYLLNGFAPVANDIVIDGGAFDGNTSLRFHLMGAKVYSFELDAKNFIKCKQVADKMGFVAENLGLGKEKEVIKYNNLEGASHIDEMGNEFGKIIDIDSYVIENDLPHVDFIKLDIEGAELDALKGARNTIAIFKPKMAICTYHKTEDIWELAQYIKSIRPDYEFAWRHYPGEVTSRSPETLKLLNLRSEFGLNNFMKTEWEKVLYCR